MVGKLKEKTKRVKKNTISDEQNLKCNPLTDGKMKSSHIKRTKNNCKETNKNNIMNIY